MYIPLPPALGKGRKCMCPFFKAMSIHLQITFTTYLQYRELVLIPHINSSFWKPRLFQVLTRIYIGHVLGCRQILYFGSEVFNVEVRVKKNSQNIRSFLSCKITRPQCLSCGLVFLFRHVTFLSVHVSSILFSSSILSTPPHLRIYSFLISDLPHSL